MSGCDEQDILKSLQDVLKIKQMKHFALVVRTATSKRCCKMSVLRNSDLLHEVHCTHCTHVCHVHQCMQRHLVTT